MKKCLAHRQLLKCVLAQARVCQDARVEVRSQSLGQSLLSNLSCLIGPCCLSQASWPESFRHDSCLLSGLSAGALRLQMATATFLFLWVLGTCSPVLTYVQHGLSPAPYFFPELSMYSWLYLHMWDPQITGELCSRHGSEHSYTVSLGCREMQFRELSSSPAAGDKGAGSCPRALSIAPRVS